MRTTELTVVGYKVFTGKTGKNYKIIFFTCEPYEGNIEGAQAGYLWVNPNDYYEIGATYTGAVGYDRDGRFGVVGII